MIVPYEVMDLTGSHIVIDGTLMILDDTLTIDQRVELRVEQESKAVRHRKKMIFRETVRRNKMANKERQAGRDKYRIAYLETYHNCIESDIALTILKKKMN